MHSVVVCIGDLMIVLDATIVNVALPSIRPTSTSREASLAWVVNAYLLTFGGFLLLGGRLGDLCGAAARVPVGHRALHARLARLRPRELAGDARRGPRGAGRRRRDRGRVRSRCYDAVHGAGRAREGDGRLRLRRVRRRRVGVLLGGVLTERSTGTGSSSSTSRSGSRVVRRLPVLLPRDLAAEERGGLDVGGAVTVTGALMVAVYAIVNGDKSGWTSGATLGLLVVAVVLLGVVRADREPRPAPLVPLEPLQAPDARDRDGVAALLAAAMFAWFFLSALYLQRVLGYSPLDVGWRTCRRRPMGAFSLGLSAKVVMRFGIRTPLVAGLALVAAGLLLVRARPGRRDVRHRRAAVDDPARARRRARLQPAAARRDGRRRARAVGPRLGPREHDADDGRRARARRSSRASPRRGRPTRTTSAT